MKRSDAAQILGLSGQLNPELIQTSYRKAAKLHHPNINPAGAEMMKIINSAYDAIKEYTGLIDRDTEAEDNRPYSEAVNEALNRIIGLNGLEIEICGAWVWVGGDTFSHRDVLKEANFRYANKKKRWYFRPVDWSSSSRGSFTMEDIRSTHGSHTPGSMRQKYIEYEQQEASAN